MVIKELLFKSISELKKEKPDNPVFEVHQIAKFVFNMTPTELVLNHNTDVSGKQEAKFHELLCRRINGEPLQYILGTQEFMSLEFKVGRNVLIPRPDTETLVEEVLKIKSGFSLLDIGTGTGCIPLSVTHYNPRAYVRGIDISDYALCLAKENSRLLHLDDRSDFVKCDIMTQIPSGRYDVITSNPPYIKSSVIDTLQTEVKDFEPHSALDGGNDGLDFYRRICDIAPKLLTENGLIYFEIGFDQAAFVKKLLEDSFENITVTQDLSGNDRVVSGRIRK